MAAVSRPQTTGTARQAAGHVAEAFAARCRAGFHPRRIHARRAGSAVAPAARAEGRLMFTGIVQEVGQLRRSDARGEGGAQDRRMEISYATIARDRLNLGDSICVDGVCLTVAEHGNSSFFADVSGETLRVTTLGAKLPGALVNLEPALRAGDSLGGH